MRREARSIQALLWRTFTPAIVIVAVGLAALVYTRLYDTILDGFSRKLVTTSALTAGLVDPADHDGLTQLARAGAAPDVVERDPRYLRNVIPMRKVRQDLGLTYLYSQVLGGTKDVVYVLDASQGEQHSPIGSEDTLPADTTAGLKRVVRSGGVYVSPIQFQQQWGLLKTAAAPFRGSDGRIAATFGADVNIGVIQVATQNALFASALIGVGSLLACALATLSILRGVAQPIEGLKADALRIAAGDRNPPSRRRGPREVTKLREALGDLATQLIARMRTTWGEMLAEDAARDRRLLETVLAAEPAVVTLVDDEAALVVWIAPPATDVTARLQRRAMVNLAQRIAADPGLRDGWRGLVAGDLVAVDRAERRVRNAGDGTVHVILGGAAMTLAPGEERPLAGGQVLRVVGPQGTAQLAWEART